jgi:hypothetical protein
MAGDAALAATKMPSVGERVRLFGSRHPEHQDRKGFESTTRTEVTLL